MTPVYPPVIKGQRYGRWSVLSDPRRGKHGFEVLCLCDCGIEKFVQTGYLKNGKSRSCGCLMRELGSKRATIHGESRGRSRLYIKWQAMLQRCRDKNFVAYPRYGGRGIRVCEEWEKSYFAFKDWALDNGYQEGLTIDRIDPNGNYEPSNCRFASNRENSRNKDKPRNNTTGFKGVSFNKRAGRYGAYIGFNYEQHFLGYFDTADKAARAYDAAAKKLHGPYARLNFPFT